MNKKDKVAALTMDQVFVIANESFDDILSKPTTEYIPKNADPKSKLQLKIFENYAKARGKRTLPEIVRDLKSIDTHKYTRAKKKKRNNKLEPIEIIDDDEPMIEQDPETREAVRALDFRLDDKLNSVIKKHQAEGLKFMWDRVFVEGQGCLLAHSMGLGKSFQTIVLLIAMFRQVKKTPTQKSITGNRVLLLAPLVTLSNWMNEFRKWSVDNSENVIGEVFNFSEMGAHSGRLNFLKYWYNEGGIMLMSYEAFRNILTHPKLKEDAKNEHYRMLINPGPDIVILDEAHRIKNINSSITNLIYQINTKSRICLTGYPLQNNLMEYYYMINFVAPNLLGSREQFKASFKTLIEKCYADSPKSRKLQAAVKMYVLQLVTNKVAHRRDDSILKAQLPVKHEYVIRFKMSPAQFEGYTHLLRYAEESESALVGLIILRALCNHPKVLEMLLKRRHDRSRNKALDKEFANEKDNFYIDDDEIDQEIISIPEPESDDTMEYSEEELLAKFSNTAYDWMKAYFDRADIESWKCSGKMSFIADLAQNCNVMNEKLVIVSHSLACLDYIEQLLPIFGIKSLKISGATVGLKRQEIIDKFQNDASYGVILLSAKAAAIGINLTAANRIVLVDQDWNPLYDEQSIGRIYRYGQTKPVHVYRLITASTIEERIFLQSIHKRSIATRIIDNKMAVGISKDELTEYYKLPEDVPLVDLETLDPALKNDFIESTVLRENRGCINSCRPYEEDVGNRDNVSSWVTALSEHDRNTAKAEALQLFKNWRRF